MSREVQAFQDVRKMGASERVRTGQIRFFFDTQYVLMEGVYHPSAVLSEEGWSTFPLSNVSLSFYMDDVTTVTFIKRILMSQQLKKTVHQVRVQKPDSQTL